MKVGGQMARAGIFNVLKQKVMDKLPRHYNATQTFRVQLTAGEWGVLGGMLPRGYSIQIDSRPPKDKCKKSEPKHQGKASHREEESIEQLLDDSMRPCGKILLLLKNNKNSFPFLEPVQPEEMGIPDYFDVIKEPMDLSTIEAKLRNGHYDSPIQFHADIGKIINNSYIFNAKEEDFLKVTADFQRYYLKVGGADARLNGYSQNITKMASSQSKSNKKKKKGGSNRDASECLPLRTEEKLQLAGSIRNLSKEYMKGIKAIVFDNPQIEENVFDLQTLSTKKLKELQKYIYLRNLQAIDQEKAIENELNEARNLDQLESEDSYPFPELKETD